MGGDRGGWSGFWQGDPRSRDENPAHLPPSRGAKTMSDTPTQPPFDPGPTTLTGHGVELRPAVPADARELLSICPHDDLAFSPAFWGVSEAADVVRIIERFTADPTVVPFTIRAGDRVTGFTTYLDIRPAHRGLEVGHTWIGRVWRGTHVNPAAKLLLFEHAFERLGAIRVSLKTDARNLRSQGAIAKLGAVREGVLRSHLVLPDGFRRDTVYYSILDSEWPRVREGLQRRLAEIDGRS